jgi:hypothetical protein
VTSGLPGPPGRPVRLSFKQVPIHVPVNAVGNTVNVIGALNPAFGNESEND